MNRRFFLQSSIAVLAADAVAKPTREVIDVNFSLGKWPGRDLPPLGAAELQAKGITHAITGSFEALLARDLTAVNAQLAEACAKSGGSLIPAGSVNPLLPAWRAEMKRCRDQHGMKVVRIHPGCHGYALSDAVFDELLGEATRAGLALQLVAQIEDVRTQHPLWRTRVVDLAPLAGLLQRHPQARVMVLNANAAIFSTALRGCSSVWADWAMLEGVGGVDNLLQSWPREKLCLGTHAPFFYPEAGLLKIAESALADELEVQVTASNARRFLG